MLAQEEGSELWITKIFERGTGYQPRKHQVEAVRVALESAEVGNVLLQHSVICRPQVSHQATVGNPNLAFASSADKIKLLFLIFKN